MIIEQSDIDALLAEAGELAATAAESFAPEAVAPVVPPARPAPPRRAVSTGMSAALQRVLRLRVPVIVRLAQRPMPISAVRDISVGSIIEFEKSVEDRLDLLVNNRLVGHGQCVKVGENFGLRLSAVISPADRVRTLGE